MIHCLDNNKSVHKHELVYNLATEHNVQTDASLTASLYVVRVML